MTTTKQINDALSNNLLQIEKAEINYKSTGKTKTITDTFLDNIQFLGESGCFADRVGWHFEKDHTTGGYVIETGRKDRNSEIIISANLCVGNGVETEDIEQALLFNEESEE